MFQAPTAPKPVTNAAPPSEPGEFTRMFRAPSTTPVPRLLRRNRQHRRRPPLARPGVISQDVSIAGKAGNKCWCADSARGSASAGTSATWGVYAYVSGGFTAGSAAATARPCLPPSVPPPSEADIRTSGCSRLPPISCTPRRSISPPLRPKNRASLLECSNPPRVNRRCERKAPTIERASSLSFFSHRCILRDCARRRRQLRLLRRRDRPGRANLRRYSVIRKSRVALQRLRNLLQAALPPKPFRNATSLVETDCRARDAARDRPRRIYPDDVGPRAAYPGAKTLPTPNREPTNTAKSRTPLYIVFGALGLVLILVVVFFAMRH